MAGTEAELEKICGLSLDRSFAGIEGLVFPELKIAGLDLIGVLVVIKSWGVVEAEMGDRVLVVCFKETLAAWR